MVSSCRNNGTISQELRYPFTGTVVQFWQESSVFFLLEERGVEAISGKAGFPVGAENTGAAFVRKDAGAD